MIIVRLKGGLGNQMFQYALGRVLAIKNNTELKIDTSYLNSDIITVTKRDFDLDIFNLDFDILQYKDIPFINRIHKNKIYIKICAAFKKFFKIKGTEVSFNFNSDFLNLSGDVYLDGYFQSPKYFNEYQDVIRKDFIFKNNFSENIISLMKEINEQNSLCIHVRRGDYVGNAYHDVVGREYYSRGVEKIKNLKKIDKIYIFSDDIDWCGKNMNFDLPVMFVGMEYAGSKNSGHMALMSSCKYFIIANSSFSWWTAWLSSHPEKIVIAPKKWFGDPNIDTSDLIPEDWVRI